MSRSNTIVKSSQSRRGDKKEGQKSKLKQKLKIKLKHKNSEVERKMRIITKPTLSPIYSRNLEQPVLQFYSPSNRLDESKNNSFI